MIIYKFKSLRSCTEKKHFLDIIENERCFCSKWENLNDPLEGYFSVYERTRFSKAIVNGKNQIRVCSFARYYSNPLLWSYYADGFKGVCIAVEFKGKDSTFIESVKYESEIPEFNDSEHEQNIPDSIADKLAKKALTTKLSYWKHESEIRALAKFEKSDNDSHINCKIKGVLHSEFIDEKILNKIKKISREKNFEVINVRLDSDGNSHQCDGAVNGVRLISVPIKGWKHNGSGPLSGWVHPSKHCQLCCESDRIKLEHHYIKPIQEGGNPSPENTALLCANCHKIQHTQKEINYELLKMNCCNKG